MKDLDAIQEVVRTFSGQEIPEEPPRALPIIEVFREMRPSPELLASQERTVRRKPQWPERRVPRPRPSPLFRE